MQCRLCQQNRELCESHIIPEFLYRTLYSQRKHQFFQLSGPPKARKWQQGFRERMLCRICEEKLSRWETYAAQILFGGREITIENKNNSLLVHHVDYQKFKLFQLSLIWRAGASSIQQYSSIKLGQHERTLRSLIENEDPAASSVYGCLMILTPTYFELTSKMMMAAQETRFDGHRCYMFLMAGLSWVFFVSSHPNKLPYSDRLFLGLNGILPILIENRSSKTFFEKSFADLKRSGSLERTIARI